MSQEKSYSMGIALLNGIVLGVIGIFLLVTPMVMGPLDESAPDTEVVAQDETPAAVAPATEAASDGDEAAALEEKSELTVPPIPAGLDARQARLDYIAGVILVAASVVFFGIHFRPGSTD